MENYNRVLKIPSIRMEDQGEYVCRISNDNGVKEGSINLSIQGKKTEYLRCLLRVRFGVARLKQNIFRTSNLFILAEPNFTIPLTDRHVDIHTDLTWTCEAFGVPDVTYKWFRNGEPLGTENLSSADVNRYTIQDNILTIKNLNPERDPAMYQCRATNTLKTKYSSAQLRVLCTYFDHLHSVTRY